MVILTRLASEAGASVPNNMLACRVIQPDWALSSPEGRVGRCQPAPISKPVCHTGHASRSRAGLLFDVLAMPTTWPERLQHVPAIRQHCVGGLAMAA